MQCQCSYILLQYLQGLVEASWAKQRGVQAVQRPIGGGQHQDAAAAGSASNSIQLVEESRQEPLLDASAGATAATAW